MSRTFAAFEIDDDIKRAIEMEQAEAGASKSNIVRRALRAYLKHHLDKIPKKLSQIAYHSSTK